MAIEYAYELRAGTGCFIELAVTTDGEGSDLTGAAFVYVIAASEGGPPLVSKAGTVSSGHTVGFQLSPEDTADLAGEYYHECKVKDTVNQLPTGVDIIDPATKESRLMVRIRPSSAVLP
ncbi:hypothetical protein [Pseudodesulfovibrio karagichevae]|uniref:Uncharacterized protein n=1 Tax=Pseudodesulfovibrio karagichevae TaxID=3239305 RepID=A0ABV4K4V0_9BACT